MADVATTCYAGVSTSTSGRAVVRKGKLNGTSSVDPKINNQAQTATLETKYDTFVMYVRYYSGDTPN